jgi:hypothetical protein
MPTWNVEATRTVCLVAVWEVEADTEEDALALVEEDGINPPDPRDWEEASEEGREVESISQA